MQTLSTVLADLREKGAWFVRASQIRLLLVRTSAESWDEVLRTVADMQFHPENRSHWVFLSGLTAEADSSRKAKAGHSEENLEDGSGNTVVVLTPAPAFPELESKIEALLAMPSLAGCRFVLVLDPTIPLLPRLMRMVGEAALACDCRIGKDDTSSPEGQMAQILQITSNDRRATRTCRRGVIHHARRGSHG